MPQFAKKFRNTRRRKKKGLSRNLRRNELLVGVDEVEKQIVEPSVVGVGVGEVVLPEKIIYGFDGGEVIVSHSLRPVSHQSISVERRRTRGEIEV